MQVVVRVGWIAWSNLTNYMHNNCLIFLCKYQYHCSYTISTSITGPWSWLFLSFCFVSCWDGCLDWPSLQCGTAWPGRIFLPVCWGSRSNDYSVHPLYLRHALQNPRGDHPLGLERIFVSTPGSSCWSYCELYVDVRTFLQPPLLWSCSL